MIDTKEIRKALAIHGVDVLNEDEVLDVLDHLEAAYKEIESWKGLARHFRWRVWQPVVKHLRQIRCA